MTVDHDSISAASLKPFSILHALPSAVVVIDELHAIQYANAEFAKLLKTWPQHELAVESGANYIALAEATFAASDRSALETSIQMILMGVSQIDLEYAYILLTEEHSLALALKPIALEQGGGGVLIQHVDITPHKQSSPTNDHMRREYELAMLMLKAAGEGIFTLNSDGMITFANPAVHEMLDWNLEDLVGKYYTKIVQRGNQMDRGVELTPIRSALGEGLTCTIDRLEFWRKDGTGVPVEFTCAPIRNQKDEIEGVVVTFKDISERKKSEAEQRRLVAILDATTDMVSISDMEGRPLYLNHAGRRMMGFNDDDDISQTIIADYHPEWASKKVAEEGIPTAIRDGWWIGETALMSSSGREMPLSQVIMAHRDADGNLEFLSTVGRNLTLFKQSEEMLRSTIAQEAMLRANESLINELSAPLLAVSDGVLLLPLIGAFSGQRTQHLSDTLAAALAGHPTKGSLAPQLIIDLSSQRILDPHLVGVLRQILQRAAGTATIRLAGLAPANVASLQSHDLDLEGVATHEALRDALRTAFLAEENI